MLEFDDIYFKGAMTFKRGRRRDMLGAVKEN